MLPDLFAHNPASHLVWWVAAGLFGMLVLFLVVELLDWLRDKLRRQVVEGEDGVEWGMHEPETTLRRRFYQRLVPILHYVHESRPKHPERDH